MKDERPPGKGMIARWLHWRTGAGADEAPALRELVLLATTAIIIIVVAFVVAFRFVRPAPPDTFVISTGADGGAYQLFARRYVEFLAHERVGVEPRASSGSTENVHRLADPESGVDVAFVQGGVGDAAKQPGLVTLAALYYEPLWVFYRGEQELSLLTQLADKRVAIGPDGSGTRALALVLLAANKMDATGERFLSLGGAAAAEALIAGKIDAAMFVAGADAPYVHQLLRAPGVRLMSFGHAEALSRRYSYLAPMSLPRGVIDIAADIPPQDVTLVATMAYLVARRDFHPALVAVLLEAVHRVHRVGDVFHRSGDFPAGREGDFPLSEEAQQFFKSGPPFLQRYLPFWVANLIQRMLVLLVPLIAVAIPVMRIFPGIYVWRIRARVFRWYRELKAVEAEAAQAPGPERVRELLARLDTIYDGVNHTRVPLAYSDYAYNLKLHIDLIRGQLQRLPAKSDGA